MFTDIIRITSKKKLLAVIIKAKFKQDGIKFFVPDDYPQQLGYMKRLKGYCVVSHSHKPVLRKIKLTQEVLFIRSGKIRIDFYDEKKHYVESKVVKQGDVVFLASGGHGFEFLEDADIFEVKQGPFLKEVLPMRFDSVKKDRIKLKK